MPRVAIDSPAGSTGQVDTIERSCAHLVRSEPRIGPGAMHSLLLGVKCSKHTGESGQNWGRIRQLRSLLARSCHAFFSIRWPCSLRSAHTRSCCCMGTFCRWPPGLLFRPPAACLLRWRRPPTSRRPPKAATRRCGCSVPAPTHCHFIRSHCQFIRTSTKGARCAAASQMRPSPHMLPLALTWARCRTVGEQGRSTRDGSLICYRMAQTEAGANC